ncbi:phage tail length tape measure family protein [Novosphingobium sp. KCTC 2891]|uniref:phage tail length tape measure family protein n=1 Tax=Novosphingobium sp. KCTC 2891 TaxID=2989730 RepID=UPI002222EB37|nr:phage tail length tape measure family protein [Novosphingobium sp. KCTC 2891]MCW1381516.1 phage tail length tape measure family protein [Novosphingobium sp. KCTC 2891]
MSTQKDVSLVIRAKDEASRALEGINRVIGDLVRANSDVARSGEQASGGLSQALQTVLSLDRAVSGLTGKFDAAQSGLAQQAQAIATTADRLSAVRGQMTGAASAADRLRTAIVDALLSGADAEPLRQKLRAAESAMKSLEGEAGRLQSTLTAQQARYGAAGEAVRTLEGNLNALAAAQRAAREESDQLAGAIDRQAKASNVRPTIERATGVTRDRGDYDQLTAQLRQESQQAAEKEAAAIKRLRDELNPLAVVEARVAAETAKLNEWQQRGEITADEHRQALALLRSEADRAAKSLARAGGGGKGNFLGLEPYQLQNLGYQVNDVFTQLASGTSIMQTLGQQGGQIIQIFPRVGSAIAAGLTSAPILGAVAAIGGLVLALKEAGDQAERLRTFNAILAANADGAAHSAERLNEATKALTHYGLSAEDALASVRTFNREGIDDSRLTQFGKAAADTAEVMGVDLKQAAKEVADGLTGGYNVVVKLDEAYNFLTATQREQIRALFEEGRAGEARTLALSIYSQKMGDAADKQRGPWASAARELGGAWSELLNWFSDLGPIKGAADAIASIGRNLAALIRQIRGTTTEADVQAQIAGAQANIRGFGQRARDGYGSAGAQQQLDNERKRLATLQDQLRTIQAQNAAEQQRGQQGGSDTRTNGENTPEAKRAADTIRALSLEEELQQLRDKADKGLTAAEARRREELAAQIAYNKEIQASGNTQIALKQRELALEHERAQILRQNEEAAKNATAEREREINQFTGRVIGAEGGAGQNPFSTASGFGQFTNGTWLAQFRKVFAEEAARLSDFQILALRQNSTVAKAIIDNYARENARFLEGFGAKVTAGNLYLAHFLGPAGAKRILTADRNMPVDQILSDKVLNGNRGYLYTDGGKGRARTAGELQTFIAGRVGDTGAAQTAGQVAINGLIEEGKRKQDEFNLSVQQANEERQRQIGVLTTENQLQGEALIQAQRQAAIDKAEFDLRQRVTELNKNLKPGQEALRLSDEQIAKTRELAAAEFDLAHARDLAQAKSSDAERRMNDLTADRDAIKQQIEALRAVGDSAGAAALVPKLQGVNNELRAAIDQAIAFYEALDPKTDPLHRTREQIEAIIARLKGAQTETTNWTTILGISGETIARTFASGAAGAIDKFAQAVAEGKNVFTSLKDAFLSFASDFLRQIAQMIEQQIIFNLVSGLLRSIGGSIGGSVGGIGAGAGSATNGFGAVGGVMAHAGGVIGSGSLIPGLSGAGLSGPRAVSPGWFKDALRYHTGGIAGLKPNEVPAILQRNEEVLTRDDPRHSWNGGGAPAGPVNLKVVNAIDAGDMYRQGLASKAGEKAFLNFVRDNAGAVRQALS